MEVKVGKSSLCGSIPAMASKSYLHRALIAAALGDSACEIIGKNSSEDILATVAALNTLGASITHTVSGYYVNPAYEVTKYCEINANESGSTLRFLLPVSAAITAKCNFSGSGRLAERPISGLTDVLKTHGVSVQGDCLPLSVSGGLNSGEFVIDGGVSSQYVSGLMFALPLLKGDSKIIIEGTMASANYVDITISVLELFGVKVEKIENGYSISGGQKFHSPKQVVAEGDWSNAAFWLAGGALTSEVTVTGLDCNDTQGDKVVVDLLKKAGAKVKVSGDSVCVKHGELKAVSFDATNTPDLVPIMAVVAGASNGISKISGVDRLRLKESDRLSAVMNMLESFGIKTKYYDNTLEIIGGKLSGGSVDGVNDHRIVMSAAIAAAVAGDTEVSSVEAVNKSYPEFFKDYLALGGKLL